MGLKEFIEEVNNVNTGKEQFHMRIYFDSENYYLIFKRLNIKRLYVIKDILDIQLVDGRVLELKITDDLKYWFTTDLESDE